MFRESTIKVAVHTEWCKRFSTRDVRQVVSIVKCLVRHSVYTVMRRLRTGIRSEKCVVRRFRRCANVIECTDTNLDSVAYYTPRLYGTYSLLLLGYKPVEHVSVVNTVGNCNTTVSIIISQSYIRSVVDRNVIMRRMNVVSFDLGRVNMDATPSFLSSAVVFPRAHWIT